MPAQSRKKIAKLLAIGVTLYASAVVLGWVLDIPFLLKLCPEWEAMKFNAAFTFVISGVTLYFIADSVQGEFDRDQVILLVGSFIIVLLMGTSLFSALLGIRTGVDELFIKDKYLGLNTVFPGRPSLATIICFLLMAAAGALTAVGVEKARIKQRLIGIVICAVGLLALVGYVLGLPHLYYYLKDYNTAMSLPTAVLFILLGTGLCL